MVEIDIKKKLHTPQGSMVLKIKTTLLDHDFVAISGDSGAGKSTLLRILAGLESASGFIQVDDTVYLKRHNALPSNKRRVGYVFAEYTLFEHLSVEQNLLYVNDDRELARRLLDLLELSPLKDRGATKLSRGEIQRVALARAMMNRPRLLLLDDPLSALSPTMREKLAGDIRELHRRFGTTTLFVTHSEEEIDAMANRSIVIRHGRIADDYEIARFSKEALHGHISELKDGGRTLCVRFGTQEVMLRNKIDGEYKEGDEVVFEVKVSKLKRMKDIKLI